MSGQGYKRTNFEDDESVTSRETPLPMEFTSNVSFRGLELPTCKQRTFQEKVLLACVGILVLVVIIMTAVLAFKNSRIEDLRTQNKKQEYCLTAECVNIASVLMAAMDNSVNPCEDFYQYACGGWMKNNPIPSGYSRWGTFELMWQKNMLVMRNALDKPDASFDSKSELKAKKYYTSCMDEGKLIEKAGAKPLLDLIGSLGWGFDFKEWNHNWTLATDWNLNKMIESVQLKNVRCFFSISVSEDDKNSSTNILQIDQAGLGLPGRDYYLNKTIEEDKVLSAYLKYMVSVFQLLGAPNETFTRDSMIKVIELETKIADMTLPLELRRDESKLYNLYNLAGVSETFPQIQWTAIINRLLNVVNITVQSNEKIVVYVPEYLAMLNTTLADYQLTEEGNKILYNYILWHVVSEFAEFLSKPFRDAKREFTEAISGLTGIDDNWHVCITNTDSVLGFAVGALFVKEAFVGESKTKAKEMINNIRQAFISNLPNLDWMDQETRAAAIEKATVVNDMIGFPDYILNKTLLDVKYENLQINESDYFGNNLAAGKYSFIKMFEKLREKPENEWMMSPPTVNAYYSASKNTIVFPAGILQAPFFDKRYPQSLNYGAMGVVMGHELTHGFDDQGREYDKNGDMRQWWNELAIQRFTNKTKCMVDQYSQYQLHGEHERGKQTLGENIADNGGLKSAYHAYKKFVKENGEEQLLPALGLTHEQIFFLSFSQVWCWNSKPETDHMQFLTDPHSPAKFRVIGPLSNSYEFSRVYNCDRKSSMNPKPKCEIW